MIRTSRSGFTVVELTVAMAMGLLVMSSALAVLNTASRNGQFLISWATTQQTLRQGLAALSSDLRQASARDGDLLAMTSDSVTVRSALTFGVTCASNYAATDPTVTVRRDEHWMRSGDSILVLADTDPATAIDDRWVRGVITDVDSTQTCPDASAAQTLTVPALAGIPDTVRAGGPARTFEWRTYAIREVDGGHYLTVRFPSAPAEPVAGPFPDPSVVQGLDLQYLNSFGAPATAVTNVTQLRLTLRAERRSSLKNGSREIVPDSVLAWIRLR